MGPSNETPGPGPRPRRRWLRRALAAIGALVVVLVAALFTLVHNLDRPFVKRRLLSFARAAAGTEIDFRDVEVHELSGMKITGVVVATPGALARYAPSLAEVDAIEVAWSTRSLFGDGPPLERIAIHGVRATVVVDEDGKTSFDGFPPSSAPLSPPTPLSKLPGSIFAGPLPVGRVDVDGVSLALLRTAGGEVVDRASLAGLAIGVEAHRAPNGVRIAIGKPGAPLDLDLARTFAGATKRARLGLGLLVDANERGAKVALDVAVSKQDFAAELPTGPIAHLDVGARFDPDKGLTAITLAGADVARDVAHAKAEAEIADDGGAKVKHLELDVDAVRLAALAPAGLVPVTMKRAELHVAVDDFDVQKPTDEAALTLDAAVDELALAGDADASLGELRAKIHGRPTAEGLSAEGTITIDAAHALGNLTVEEVAIELGGKRGHDGAIAADVTLRARRVDAARAFGVVLDDLEVALAGREIRLDPAAAFGVRGDADVTVTASSIDARGAAGLALDHPRIHLHAPVPASGPLALEAGVDAARLSVFGGRGRAVLEEPLHLGVAVKDLALDRARPGATTASAHLDLGLGTLNAGLDLTKGKDDVDYRLRASSKTLAFVAKLAGAPGDRARWEPVSLDLQSSGKIDHLAGAAPTLRESSHLVLERVGFGGAAANAVELDLASSGDGGRQEAKIGLTARGLAIDGVPLGDDTVNATAALDLDARSYKVDLENGGAVDAKVVAAATLDPARDAIAYDVAIDLAKLAKLAPLAAKIKAVAGFDLGKLALHLASRGKAFGLLKAGPFGVEATVDGSFRGVAWAREDQAIDADEARLHATIGQDAENHLVESHLDVAALKYAFGRHELRAVNIQDTLKAKLAKKLDEGEVAIDQLVSIDLVKQDLAPMYPIGKVSAHVVAARADDGVIRVAEVKIANAAGGTTLALSGGLELGEDRRRLSIRGDVEQDLARACTQKDLFGGSGRAAFTVRVESADLDVFRVRAVMKVDHANLELPGPGMKLTGVDGQIPIRADLHVKKGGVELLRDVEVNRYSVLRFSDQHPLLNRRSFVSAERIVTPAMTIAPFAANLEVVQRVVSLGQLEMGVRGGQVTGQCIIEVEGADSKLEAHLRVNGVQSSHGEPFDGNAALVLSLGDRSVEGRAEIVRIGRRHLLDLLDLEDPQRTDGAMNSVRRALALGYPDHVRISFDHGFANASVSFAGIASLLRLDDIRGVPMGPLVDKTVRSIWRPKKDRR